MQISAKDKFGDRWTISEIHAEQETVVFVCRCQEETRAYVVLESFHEWLRSMFTHEKMIKIVDFFDRI